MATGHSVFHKLQAERKKVSLLEEQLATEMAKVRSRDLRIEELERKLTEELDPELDDDDIPF